MRASDGRMCMGSEYIAFDSGTSASVAIEMPLTIAAAMHKSKQMLVSKIARRCGVYLQRNKCVYQRTFIMLCAINMQLIAPKRHISFQLLPLQGATSPHFACTIQWFALSTR